MTDSPKKLGAREMFRQSIVYLYNSYREDGLKAKPAKEQVANDIESIYNDYAQDGSMPKKTFGYADPVRLIDEIISDVDKHPDGISLKRKLHRLRSVLK